MAKKNAIQDFSGEIGIASLVVAVVALMVLPLPTMLIDGLLGLNITLSVVLLMVTMYIPSATSLSAFPSLLLFTTLLRLSLNIASTKSILLHADAGHIIESFGKLVVGGNLVVGLVVFLIITTVQFIVIAKGSERVAEVGARFTLDAMPGKQMSIDADLRAGHLSPEEARKRRALLAMESQLHGGMDGAMKFVKGDAIAGLVITLVNILAGIVIGITYHNMTAGEAANRFAVLSIGDAMVSQIPSLLISVAAGVMITRVSDEENANRPSSLGMEIVRQLSTSARAMFTASALLVGFALVPGFPSFLFFALAALIFSFGYTLRNRAKQSDGDDGDTLPALLREGSKGKAPSIAEQAPSFTVPVGVRLGAQLAKGLDVPALDTAFQQGRHALAEALGLPFPGIAIWKADALQPDSYEVRVHDIPGMPVAVPDGHLLIPNLPEALRAQALEAAELPNHPAPHWIAPAHVAHDAELTASGLRVERVIADHVVDVLRRSAHLFVGLQETQWMLERVTTDYPGLVAEAQKAVPAQRIADVLRRLLEEQVPIRNMRAILESLVVWGPKEKDTLMLLEYVRGDLGRQIAHQATGGTRQMPAILLDLSVEQTVRQAIKPTPAGNFLTLDPQQVEAIVMRLHGIMQGSPVEAPSQLAIVTSMDIRRYVRRMIEPHLQALNVYSFQELGGYVDLRPVGKLVL
ncbi:type III secretion system export apparatus subunit SctV [Ralstonia syzygii]|uniref:type III secretion system export apparatus subunit SctV n=1 Tax=Ralstonia syzygii TaxID=28097 RepID=UPI0018D13E71|nr:type III secretion system export apparatus subunit SctV [Ralstonia syzygii]